MFVVGANSPSGYFIDKSLRFRASASAYLNRTPASASNRTTWTWSAWLKTSVIQTSAQDQALFSATANTSGTYVVNDWFSILLRWNSGSPVLDFSANAGGSATARVITTQVFRDPSSWYHLVITYDSGNATSTDRVRIYVNGVRVTAFSTANYPALNAQTYINSTNMHFVGDAWLSGATRIPMDGYLADVNFIDGQALTPASFGETNALTGVWQPKAYTGTYGTNGFYLDFETTTSVSALGTDKSGNGNTWTVNNVSLTAGVTYDSMTDVPTLTSASAANYCTLNPLSNGAGTLSGGNLNHVVGGSITRCNSTIFASSGKWYFEVTLNTAGTNTSIGIGQNNITNQYPGQDSLSFVQEIDNARKGNNDVYTSYGTALTAGQVFMCAVDLDNLKIFFGGQGTWFASSDPVTGANPAFTITAGLYCAISRPFGGSAAISINFGQRPFAYTPPTGFVALNTFNLPTATILKGNTVMDATLYTGTNANQTITNAGGFRPDFLWVKIRSTSGNPVLVDSVRGVNKTLYSPQTTAEETPTAGTGILSLNSNGFSLGTDISGTSFGATNTNTQTFVAWQWQAGQGTTSSNTNGTITSTVSVNPTAGFSVVTFNTQTSGVATVGHGLGVAPSLIIAKNRAVADGWYTYHKAIGNTGYVRLNTTDAVLTTSSIWNNTSPTSAVFTMGTAFAGTSYSYVAYCFAEIDGYSKFGSYVGNSNADGPFIYCGFRPKFVLFKGSSFANNWYIIDSSTNTINVAGAGLIPNASTAETATSTTENAVDFLSNGFKLRNNAASVAFNNSSGQTFIYAAFAESPFKNSLAR